MKKVKKPVWYYIVGIFFLFGVVVNVLSSNNNKWAIVFWGVLSIFMFVVAYKKNKIYKEQQTQDIARNVRALNTLKDFYQSVLDGNDLNKTDQIISEIVNTEGFSEPQIKNIAEKAIKSIMDDTVSKEIANGSLSPEGYDKIVITAKNLNVNLISDKKTNDSLAKLRYYWTLENEDLPIVNSSISLQKGEFCYYESSCRWLEHRTVTKGISFKGITGSFKIAKGVHYRAGYIKPQRITVEALSEIDRGNVYLTNKRIIFMGAKKNSNIKYSAVLSIVPYSDGVGIEKDSGKSPILICNDPDVMARILARLNKE